MDKRAQLEQFLWNAAKAPDSDAARPVIQERAGSRDRLREAVNILQRMLSAEGYAIRGTAVVYRVTEEQYRELLKRLQTEAVRRKTITKFQDIENIL